MTLRYVTTRNSFEEKLVNNFFLNDLIMLKLNMLFTKLNLDFFLISK